jgi:hypothetical protein
LIDRLFVSVAFDRRFETAVVSSNGALEHEPQVGAVVLARRVAVFVFPRLLAPLKVDVSSGRRVVDRVATSGVK